MAATWSRSLFVALTQRASQTALLAGRIEFIDVARGLFIVWMIAGHALNMAGVPPNHPLHWLRPSGWATFCFALLTGITIPLIFDRPGEVRVGARGKLCRRAFNIALIAYLSNFASRIITATLSGSLSPAYAWGVLTFQIPWSISSILIVTTCVLVFAPVLLWCTGKLGPGSLFVVVTMLILSFDLLMQADGKWIALPAHVRQCLKGGGLFEFPIIQLVLYSFWFFCLANLAKRVFRSKGLFGITSLLAVMTGTSFAILMLESKPLGCITWLTRFGMSIGIAIMITEVGIFRAPKALLGALGRVGLLVFLLHRPTLHIIFHELNGILKAPDLAIVMIALCLGPALMLGIYRDRKGRFSRVMRKFGF